MKRPGILSFPEGVEVLKGRQARDNADAAEMHVDAVWLNSIGRLEDP